MAAVASQRNTDDESRPVAPEHVVRPGQDARGPSPPPGKKPIIRAPKICAKYRAPKTSATKSGTRTSRAAVETPKRIPKRASSRADRSAKGIEREAQP